MFPQLSLYDNVQYQFCAVQHVTGVHVHYMEANKSFIVQTNLPASLQHHSHCEEDINCAFEAQVTLPSPPLLTVAFRLDHETSADNGKDIFR
jgi:hypothetical protein